jgi:radical SAM protein with 4Fe4S-binding SPASM domain
MLEWIEFNPTMICHSPFLDPQPSVKGKFSGCSYCYAAEGMPHTIEEVKKFKSKELTTIQIKNFLDQAAELGVKRLCILGGEPQVRADFNEIISHACKKIALVQLTTNGIGTANNLATLLKIPLLEISVDSNELNLASQVRPKAQVRAALEAIDLLHDKHSFLCINCVITPPVLPSLWSFIEWAFREKNIKKINLYPLLNENIKELSITKHQSDEIISKASASYIVVGENYCKSGKHVIVDYDGSVVPCAAFLGTDVTLGTVTSLKQAVENPLMEKFKKYDFKSVAPKNPKSFESSNCPGKELYDTDWNSPKVELSDTQNNSKEMYCMRCNMKQTSNSKICSYCGFGQFDNKAFSMVCSCFSLLNPKFYSKKNQFREV